MTDAPSRLTAALEGRYRIERRLGEGGMATVYLAEDLKHERKVALKVLRPELAAVIGAERFVSEIKTTANLQHPHILTLFDSGEADGFLYYVMPFIDGESLRERLDRERQLGVDEAVRIARDVADALDYAHRHEVIHRDIKPENILLHDGRPVVADFGIALAISAAGGGRMTETGLSLGTPHYMSPEQATADRDLNARSDVYSLGCVLYEMLTGDPPHTGPTAQSILMRILTENPRPVTEVRSSVPPNVAATVAKALEKLPADRFDSAKTFLDALGDEGFTHVAAHRPAHGLHAGPAASSAGPATLETPWSRVLPWGIAAILAVVAGAAMLRPEPARPVQRFSIALEDLLIESHGPSLALSPDGSTLAYVGSKDQIYVRALSDLEARLIPGTEQSRAPFFSPDGRSVAFTQGPVNDDVIRTVSLEGGPPVSRMGDHYPGGAWGEDGFIYFTDFPQGTLHRVSVLGGEPEVVADSTSGFGFRWPQALPGGRALLLSATGEDGASVVTLDLESGALKPQRRSSFARYAGGYLFWVSAEATLMATRFDLDRLEAIGESVPLAAGMPDAGDGSADFAVAENGTLVYSAATDDTPAGSRIGWVSRSGQFTPIGTEALSALEGANRVELSHDGRLMAIEVEEDGREDIWIYDLGQDALTRLTFQGTANGVPRWLPDGRTLSYLSDQEDGRLDVYVQPSDRSGSDRRLLRSGLRRLWSYDVDPMGDAPFILDGTAGNDPSRSLYVASPGSDSALADFLVTEFNEANPRISPDGQWVAYDSDESGLSEVYVRSFPRGGRPWLVSRQGGRFPVWSPLGDEIFYHGPEGQMAVAEVELVDGVTVTSRESLFGLVPFFVGGGPGSQGSRYHVSLDGQRLLMIARRRGVQTGSIVVVLNVFEELNAALGG